MNWLRRLFGGKESAETPPHALPQGMEVRPGSTDDGATLKIDLDSFDSGSHKDVVATIVNFSGCPLFEGTVEHAYAKEYAGNVGRCPRCQAPTRQHTANFIYATNAGPRVMTVAAGHFCTACPTVIVDENTIATGTKRGCRYRRVVGVDYMGKKEMDIFRTWNGKETIMILSEDEQIEDMVTKDEHRTDATAPEMHDFLGFSHMPPARKRDAKKEKRKRKMAAKSRRQNRH